MEGEDVQEIRERVVSPISCSGCSVRGMVRPQNEDHYLLQPEKGLFVLADGMGGHNAGEVASHYAIDFLDDHFSSALLGQLALAGQRRIRSEMVMALSQLNWQMYEKSKDVPEWQGMGCALVLVLLINGRLHICHVGDCRAYIKQGAESKLLTIDHSYVMSFVKKGRMSEAEARKSPLKNKLTQAIGIPMVIEPGYTTCTLLPNDKLLLCSDGLWDMLSDDEIRACLVGRQGPGSICAQLVDQANDAGGHDNISIIVINGSEREAL